MSKHTVIIVRHAKAQNTSPGSDEKRPLSDAGREQARGLGVELKDALAQVSTAFISPAVRAQQTWDSLAKGADLDLSDVEIHSEAAIYSGSPTQIWDAVHLESKGNTSIIVGHEPTISEVARLLLKDDAENPASLGMPTGSAVLVSWNRDWKEWHSHCADLEGFRHVPHR